MKRATKFLVSPGWKILLLDMGVNVQQVLKTAHLPLDLFHRKGMTLSATEYFSFWNALADTAGGEQVALLLAEHMKTENFDPPFFAALCSGNLNQALARIQQYKPLIGPMNLRLEVNSRYTRLEIDCYGYQAALPQSLALCELVFFTQLARIATRKRVSPFAVTMPELPENQGLYHDYFGCRLSRGQTLGLSFHARDATADFVTSNEGMWSFFEDKLNQRLFELELNSSTSERVRAILLECLPAGETSIETVASQLSMSKRSLQRKLFREQVTYQSLLQSVRLDLAEHYLQKSQLSLGEISFMLGFNEPNSFIRAYSQWKGIPPGEDRSNLISCQ